LDSSLFSTSASASLSAGRTAAAVVVVGNPQPKSRTRAAAELVGRQLAALTSTPDDILVIDLADVGPQLLEWGNASIAQLKTIVLGAQALVVASPTYKASYTGLLKMFLDQFERDELGGVTTVAVMTGGSPAHSLVVETQLKPVLVEIGASLPTRGVYLSGSQIDEPNPVLSEWYSTARRPLERIIWR
jgi:FMN reductase